MKISILGPAYPFRGGIAALNERLAQQLIKEGHEVNIVSFKVQYPKLLFPGKTQFVDQKAEFEFPITREIHSVNPFNWLKVGRKIKKQKPDILLVRFWIPFMAMCLGSVCRIVCRNKHTRIISIADNFIPHEKRPGDRILSSYFANSVDGFIAMSESVLTDIENFDPTKPKLYTPHPIYDHYGEIEDQKQAIKKLALPIDSKYILFFGFIRDYKGLDLLIKAFSDSYFKKNKIKLLVAGEFYTDSKPYFELIKTFGLEDSIILNTDYIPNSKVPDYFNAAAIVAQPYKSATQSGVTQIAYHFNKPMLVTNVGGLAEIIPHGKAGYVVDIHPKEITGALIDFFENNRESEFIQNVIKEKNRFSWDKMTKIIFELYTNIHERKQK